MDLYPKSIIGYVYVYFKQLFTIVNANDQKALDQKKMSTHRAVKAMAPKEVKWSNLQYSFFNRIQRILIINGITFLLLGAALGIIYGLNFAQANIDIGTHYILATGLSVAISVVITVINIILNKLLRTLTK